MEKFDRGSAIVIEVEFKRNDAFGTPTLFDPTSPTISIIDIEGTLKVTDAALTKSTTGKWSYICQTLTAWESGIYKSRVKAVSGSYNDVTVDPLSFELI